VQISKFPLYAGDDVTVRLAPGTPTGRVLRVKGRGIIKGAITGDLLVTIEVQVPRRVEGEALDALKKFAELTVEQDVRVNLTQRQKHE
jgi:molecular chaperone DnaJ